VLRDHVDWRDGKSFSKKGMGERLSWLTRSETGDFKPASTKQQRINSRGEDLKAEWGFDDLNLGRC